MADDTKKSGGTEQDETVRPDAIASGYSDLDPHFGDLDVADVYRLPSVDPPLPSAAETGFMLGAEGQELAESTTPAAAREDDVSEEVSAFMVGLSEDYDLEMPFDISPEAISVLGSAPDANLFELPLDAPRSLVDLDQLFDAVGAKSIPNPFTETPDQQVALEDTFWDKAVEDQPATDPPELFEALVAIDPSRALDNFFETLYVADES